MRTRPSCEAVFRLEASKASVKFICNPKTSDASCPKMSDQTFGDEWLRNKNVAFRQMLERQEFESAAEYAIMFSALYADQSRDMENASWELAQTFENTAFMLKAMSKHNEADGFNSRAETIRQKLDHEELERMLAAPPVMPDVYGPNDKPFEL